MDAVERRGNPSPFLNHVGLSNAHVPSLSARSFFPKKFVYYIEPAEKYRANAVVSGVFITS
jgi:hypothetical protein